MDYVGLYLYASDEPYYPAFDDGKESLIVLDSSLTLLNYNRDYNQNILDFDF